MPVQTLLTTAGGTNSPIINGTTLTTQLQKAFASGAINHVRAIMGVDRDEDLTGSATTGAQYLQLVRTQYGALAPRILALYPLGSYGSPFIAYRTVAADSNTVCPALVRDRRLSRWIGVYAYEGDDTDAPPSSFEGTTNPGGAFHVDELGFLFPGCSVSRPTTTLTSRPSGTRSSPNSRPSPAPATRIPPGHQTGLSSPPVVRG